MSNVRPLNAAAAAHLAGHGPLPAEPVIDTHDDLLAGLARTQLERRLTDADYKPVIDAFDVGKRRIQQMLKELRGEERAAQRSRFELTDRHRAGIVATSGNVHLAYEQLVRDGEQLPVYATFWRRWHDELVAIQSFASDGAEGFAKYCVYPPYEAPHRNAVWQADGFELPNEVVADGCTTTLVKPWLLLFEDDRSRMDMAWALVATPNCRIDAETVCATIASAIRIRLVDGIEVGGAPGVIRWDNDKSFLAGMVTMLATAIGFDAHAVPPRSGHLKGKIERLGGTIQTQFCPLQPRYTHGPATRAARNPMREEDPITADMLRMRLANYFGEYRTRQHSELGATPFDVWAIDPEPLRRVSDDRLRSALLRNDRKRKVQKKGVYFDDRYWASADVLKAVGRTATVRHPVGPDPDFIEVYVDGKWIGTAWPAKTLTQSQRDRVRDANSAAYREARRLQDLAAGMRSQAEAAMDTTDATPAAAAMQIEDDLAADAADLYDLLTPTATEET